MRIYTAFLSNHESVFRSSHFVTHKLVLAALNASKDRSFKIPVGCLDIVRDWGWASEYMHYVLQIINLEKPNDIIIATGTSFTLRQFADEIFSSFGLKYNDHLLESESLLRPNEIKVSRLDPSKLKSVIGSIPKINTPQVARLLIRKYVDLADAQKL